MAGLVGVAVIPLAAIFELVVRVVRDFLISATDICTLICVTWLSPTAAARVFASLIPVTVRPA